jgi:2,3-dihydroxybenzoate-AMP ligase
MTRGPYTFRGYYNSPQHNASAFDADGFTAPAI